MILYRLALQRLIDYFQLNKPSKQDETRMMLLHKQKKVHYKTVLKTNKTWNFYISVLLSLIGFLLCISVPFAILENPCQIFEETHFTITHKIAVLIEKYLFVLDAIIFLLIGLLVFATIKTVADAIKNTNISISPWIERGRYTLSPDQMKKRFKCTDEYNVEISERCRQNWLRENPPKPYPWR